ncbi:hypothetical protein RHMOL_Rhmol10G0072100 [Rhododendron molle]|uniref:Uncharacterized protein n=1 Tax=Rhododendron molle TaxID=49168 RepID=A0ACC0M0V2_RHOML|nr:hypothetical protein RHMOL_Rhmol10G0072100 [Rhododendron molle]
MGRWSYKFQSASRTPDRGSTVGPFQLHRLGIIDSDLELLAGHGGVLFGPAQATPVVVSIRLGLLSFIVG